MSTLSFKHLDKIYPNKVQAVFDFNLEIKDKEFIVFVGPSGCGKSTTLRMVAGLEDITNGELYIDNRLINDVQPKDRDIAMVFQNYALYPHMTVYQNMAFALKLRKTLMPDYIKDVIEKDGKLTLVGELLNKNKLIKKEISKINRKFKKKQDALELLEPRAKLYKELYANLDKINSLRVQKVGKDEYRIAKLTKTVETLQKEIERFDNLIKGKYKDEKDKVDVFKKGIEFRQTQLDKYIKEIEYLKKNDVKLNKLRHLTSEEIDVEINKTASAIDLTRYLFRKPSELSGGQRQRVALGRAIVRRPKVFLMDEPLSNLDAKLRVQTRGEITKIHHRVGATTIYVTHDQTEAMTMADRIVIMKDGWVQQIGTPVEVYDDPANIFVAGFIGSPAMNFIKASYKRGYLSINVIKDEESNNLLSKESVFKDINIKLNRKDNEAMKKFAVIYREKLIKEAEDAVGKLKELRAKDSKSDKHIEEDILKYELKHKQITNELEEINKSGAIEVTLGARPETIFTGKDKKNTNPSIAIESACDFAELLGSELIIYTYVNGQRIIIKTGNDKKVNQGDKVNFYFNTDKLYLFEKHSGVRIK